MMATMRWLLISFPLLMVTREIDSFIVPTPDIVIKHHLVFLARKRPLFSSSPSASTTETFSSQDDIKSMRLKEIQAELKTMGVSYSDCFDRDSLEQRLVDVREGRVPAGADDTGTVAETSNLHVDNASTSTFDRETILEELRSMRVKELREECSRRRIRSVTMIEKEDFVQALLNAREVASRFSVSGALTPGIVGALSDIELEQELNNSEGSNTTPLLLDVYATWCGPCKLMAPELEQAATVLGDRVRVAKMDSDQYPMWSSKLKVGAFPTVILFGAYGNEIKRVEGAIMKDDLVRLAELGIQ